MDDAPKKTTFTLRIPEGLRDELDAEAKKANRSLTGEIIERLASSLVDVESALPPGVHAALNARATAASTSFEEELVRAVVAGLDHKAPAVLLVEVSNSISLSKVGALIDAALSKLPPNTLLRVENKPS